MLEVRRLHPLVDIQSTCCLAQSHLHTHIPSTPCSDKARPKRRKVGFIERPKCQEGEGL